MTFFIKGRRRPSAVPPSAPAADAVNNEDGWENASPGSPLPVDPADTDAQLEVATQAIGRELLERSGGKSGRILSSDFWSDKIMEWAGSAPAFKTELFRFIDAFPTLRTPEQVHTHLLEYLGRADLEKPAGLVAALKAGALAQGVQHDSINVLCLGARVVGQAVAMELVKAFVTATFTGEERHARRLAKIEKLEKNG